MPLFEFGDGVIEVGARPILMGIVNVTPDSFSDGGQFLDPAAAIEQGKRLAGDGADILDVGGESTRPGATPVPLEEELRRVLPVIEGLAGKTTAALSIDTYKPQVAAKAIERGAAILNDVTGFRDPEMVAVARRCRAGLVVMHLRGTPETMNDLARYRDVVGEMLSYFKERLAALKAAGVAAERTLVDPGIGFAKKRRHNLAVLRRIDELVRLGRPVVLGASRKRILGEVTGRPPHDRLAATVGAAVSAYLKGARVFRVHDVAPVRNALEIAAAIENAAYNPDDESR